MRSQKLYLRDIAEAMEAIEQFVEGMEIDNFMQDDKTASAVIRKFEIIGEAAKGISDDIKQRYSQVPWKEMAGMRDKLIHSYFQVNHEIVWLTIKNRIPGIKPMIYQIMNDRDQNSGEARG
jgi:uncharacterized protein with HEPN domain